MSTLRLVSGGAALFALAGALGGCSFVFVDGPPATHKQLPYFECTSSRAWPVIDTIVGAAAAIEAAGVATSGSSGGARSDVAIAAVAEAALFVGSAVYGYERTSSCREAKALLMQRLFQQQQPGPGFAPGGGALPGQLQPYDPWVSPRPGAFAPRPASPHASPPAAAPVPAVPEEKGER